MAMKNPIRPGKMIKDCIESSGLTVTETAKGLGVTRQTLSRVINTKTSQKRGVPMRQYQTSP
jgi:plasmid maintenance system antidote protein VapI